MSEKNGIGCSTFAQCDVHPRINIIIIQISNTLKNWSNAHKFKNRSLAYCGARRRIIYTLYNHVKVFKAWVTWRNNPLKKYFEEKHIKVGNILGECYNPLRVCIFGSRSARILK